MEDTLARFWEEYSHHILGLGHKILVVVLIIIGGTVIIRISRRLARKTVSEKLKIDETFASVLRIVIHYGIVIVCLIMILDVLGVNTTGLIAILGAAGVTIGFALKDTLSNIAAGIVILFLRPFQAGNFVECGTVSGFIREIGLFTTIMETPDGVFISAPNSNFWGIPLKNFSRNLKRRLDITIAISYSDSIDTAFKALGGIIDEEQRFLKDPPPMVMVQSLGESGIGITLRAWVESANYWRVNWDIMKKVKEKIQEAGLTVAFPRREVHLMKDTRDFPEDVTSVQELTMTAKDR